MVTDASRAGGNGSLEFCDVSRERAPLEAPEICELASLITDAVSPGAAPEERAVTCESEVTLLAMRCERRMRGEGRGLVRGGGPPPQRLKKFEFF